MKLFLGLFTFAEGMLLFFVGVVLVGCGAIMVPVALFSQSSIKEGLLIAAFGYLAVSIGQVRFHAISLKGLSERVVVLETENRRLSQLVSKQL